MIDQEFSSAHLLEAKLLDAGLVGGNGGALDADAMLLRVHQCWVLGHCCLSFSKLEVLEAVVIEECSRFTDDR